MSDPPPKVAYLPIAGYCADRIITVFDGRKVTRVLEMKRRYEQSKRVSVQAVEDADGNPLQSVVVTHTKRREYYKQARWSSGRFKSQMCLCPCEPACYAKTKFKDEEWSTDDEEGVRVFYATVSTHPTTYEAVSTQCLQTGKLTSNHVDNFPGTHNDIDDFFLPEMKKEEYNSFPWTESGPEPPSCFACNKDTCLWILHKEDVVTYIENVFPVDLADMDLNQVGNTRRAQRKLAFRHASRLIHGFLGKGVHKRHAGCVESGIRHTYPSPTGVLVGYHSA